MEKIGIIDSQRYSQTEQKIIALRTAFVARFIVLREGRRSRAHRTIEDTVWSELTTAEDLIERFRDAFINNGDRMEPIERDFRRALDHARKSVEHFVDQYLQRHTLNFREALVDYQKSNALLFGVDQTPVAPKQGGWKY